MKKCAIFILIISSNLALANEMIREEYNPKPMVEGNRRVDELIEWNKNHPGEMPPLTEQEKYEFFTKKGMPIPGSGASVIEKNNGYLTKEQSASINKFNSDQKSKGYYESENKKVKLLLDMPQTAEKEFNERKMTAFNPLDTHLYENKTDMAMAYDYAGVPSNIVFKAIGYAPESSFVNNGWSGAVEFFVPSFGGVCAYHEVNIGITKSSAFIPKEIITYKVNNKITKMNAIGNKESGFVYEIEWWDKQFKRTLECAAMDYSDSMRIKMVDLAKQIDKA